jgi:hypothetical protein
MYGSPRFRRIRTLGSASRRTLNSRPSVGIREVGTHEVGTREVGIREVGIREVGTREVGTREVGTREVGIRFNRLFDREAQSHAGGFFGVLRRQLAGEHLMTGE